MSFHGPPPLVSTEEGVGIITRDKKKKKTHEKEKADTDNNNEDNDVHSETHTNHNSDTNSSLARHARAVNRHASTVGEVQPPVPPTVPTTELPPLPPPPSTAAAPPPPAPTVIDPLLSEIDDIFQIIPRSEAEEGLLAAREGMTVATAEHTTLEEYFNNERNRQYEDNWVLSSDGYLLPAVAVAEAPDRVVEDSGEQGRSHKKKKSKKRIPLQEKDPNQMDEKKKEEKRRVSFELEDPGDASWDDNSSNSSSSLDSEENVELAHTRKVAEEKEAKKQKKIKKKEEERKKKEENAALIAKLDQLPLGVEEDGAKKNRKKKKKSKQSVPSEEEEPVTFRRAFDSGEFDLEEEKAEKAQEDADEEWMRVAERLRAMDPRAGGTGRDDNTRMPVRFQAGPPPFWLAKLNDILLFHNATMRATSTHKQSVVSALQQLWSDLNELKELKKQVEQGKDPAPTAQSSELYGDIPAEQEDEPNQNNNTIKTTEGTALEEEMKEVSQNRPRHSSAATNDTVIVPIDDDPMDVPNAALQETLLLSAEADEEDQLKPILAQTIPLWRRRGAALKTIGEVMQLLHERIQSLEELVNTPLEPSPHERKDSEEGREENRRAKVVAALGVPQSFGVDGRQSARLPPVIENAIASTTTNTLLSDIFTSPESAFTNRAARLQKAVYRQIPYIHDHYLIEEDIQPLYDELALRKPNLLEDGIHPGGGSADETTEMRSYSIHIDYIRFSPPMQSVSSATATHIFSTTTSAESSVRSDPSGTSSAEESLRLYPHFSHLKGANAYMGSRRPLTPAEAAKLVIARLRLTKATRHLSVVPFTDEECLISILLQHYEYYRLLRLNLLPHLKCHSFYEEQLRHLSASPSAAASVDVENLARQLELLRSKACEVEELSMNVMIGVWYEVLRLRGEDPQRFILPPTPQSKYRAKQELSPHHEALQHGRTEQESERRVVNEEDIFSSDYDPSEPQPREDGFGGHQATTSVIMSPPGNPNNREEEHLLVNRFNSDNSIRRSSSEERPRQFRFYLRRRESLEEVPYRSGEYVLNYVAEVEGVDVVEARERMLQLLHMDGGNEVEGGAAAPPKKSKAKEEGDDPVEKQLEQLIHFQVVVFARASAALPPQYIGCSMPRPLTTSKTVFFNETFELRAAREPQEFLLHVIPLADAGQPTRTVISTVRVRPVLTRCYLLHPMQSPIAFIFRGKTVSRYTDNPVEGVVAVSTTWTSTQGYTVEQVEDLFLKGGADPLNPEYRPLVQFLRNYYAELDRNSEELDTRKRALLKKSKDKHTRKRRGSRAGTRENERKGSIVPVSDKEGEKGGGIRDYFSQRLQFLQRRWQILTGQQLPKDETEERFYRNPIPLTEEGGKELYRRVVREVEADELKRSEYNQCGKIFDEREYYSVPSAISGLTLTPLPKTVKVHLWQERQRRLKRTAVSKGTLTDEEMLERVVTVPKFSMKLVFDVKPRSQLNPRRRARPKTDEIDREELKRRQDSSIVVHIMKANNLPLRADGTPLEPFVQAGFVYETAYSRSEVGHSPSWFETLKLPFQPLDFEEETLSMIDDDVVISVYDKVEIPIPSRTVTLGAVAHETHYRTERRLLGTLRIPFYSLHQAEEARMEGVYPLDMPRWLLGYHQINTRVSAADGGPDGASKPPLMRENPFGGEDGEEKDPLLQAGRPNDEGIVDMLDSHLEPTIQLYISLWPPLQRGKRKVPSLADVAKKVHGLNVSFELHYLHEVALKWAKTAKSKIKRVASMNATAGSREVEPFVYCSNGDLVLLCRYLLPRGGPPPKEVTNVFEAIRYVSLLPFVVDIMTWGDKDVWSTNAELLQLRSGDYEELALLLAHFLRHLAPERPSYVVIGAGEIYEQTIMVLHSFDGRQWCLIDPRTGYICKVERPYGTVFKDIQVVMSHDQMWANVQLSGLPHRMSWDLTKPEYWHPCYDRLKDKKLEQYIPFMSPIQREVLSFYPADPSQAREIENDLREELQKALLAWRNQRTPMYRRDVEAVLRELLIELEKERCSFGSTRSVEITTLAHQRLSGYLGRPVVAPRRHKKRSKSKEKKGEPNEEEKREETRFDRGYTVAGSPVTSSFNPADTHFNEILLKVFETAVHEVGTDDVNFSVGVYVKSYSGNVCAMWVLLVALCKT